MGNGALGYLGVGNAVFLGTRTLGVVIDYPRKIEIG